MNAKKILIVLRIFIVLNKKMSYRFLSPVTFLIVGIMTGSQLLLSEVVGPPKPRPASSAKKAPAPVTQEVDPLPTETPLPPPPRSVSPAPTPATNPPLMDADGKTPLYDIEKALNLALQNNFRIKAAQAGIEGKIGQLIVAKASLYPIITASARVSGSNQDPFGTTSTKTDNDYVGDWGTRILISQNIFSGFANRNRIAAAKLEQEAEYFQYQATVNSVLFDLKNQFYTILLREIEIETKKETVKQLETELERQKNLFEAGRSTKFSILRIQVNIANEKSDLLSLNQDLLTSHARLSDILGLSWGIAPNHEPNFKIKGELSIPPFSLDLPAILQMAKTRRPELQYFDKTAKASDHKAKAERASNIPRIDLYAQGDERNNTDKPAFFDHRAELSAGIVGTWNLFDGFLGKGRALQQEANRDANLARKMDETLRIESEVRTAYGQLQEARRVIETQKENVERAQESVKLSKLSVETGYGTVLDVLQATTDLSRSKNVESAARYRYIIAIAQIEQSISMRFSNALSGNETKP